MLQRVASCGILFMSAGVPSMGCDDLCVRVGILTYGAQIAPFFSIGITTKNKLLKPIYLGQEGSRNIQYATQFEQLSSTS